MSDAHIKDRWHLRELKAGQLRFAKCREDELIQLGKTISRAGEFYYKTGRMGYRIFIVSVDDGERIGVIYGLKKGWKDE